MLIHFCESAQGLRLGLVRRDDALEGLDLDDLFLVSRSAEDRSWQALCLPLHLFTAGATSLAWPPTNALLSAPPTGR